MRRVVLALLAAAGASAVVMAQIEGGDRGVAAVDSSRDFEVAGIRVDTNGPNADAARLAGWREAQRRAFQQLSAGDALAFALLCGRYEALGVSAIVVEDEEIGPNRYIARLGVLFDRDRTSSLLGVSAYVNRSPPMVVIPVVWSTGVGTAFEQRTAWQEAWARYRTGQSEVDYIRPAGNGPDPLLLNVGQTERPARGWWRAVLDQYGGLDVLMPTARLYRQWPGGPVIGVFQARHGPDNQLLGSFTLRVGSAAGLAQLLDTGVTRMDALFQQALRGGALGLDPTLSPPPEPEAAIDPDAATDDDASGETLAEIVGDTGSASAGIPVTVQFDTPGASAVANTEALVRGIPGVRSASTTSLALGGVSLMRVTYDGDPDALRAALEVRGLQVTGSGQTLRIRRAPQLLPPNLPTDDRPAG